MSETGAVASNGQVLEHLGPAIRARRRVMGLSVRGLARATDASPSLISQIELGKANPSVRTLGAIVSTLGLSLDDLVRDESEGEEAPQLRVCRRAWEAGGRRSNPMDWRPPSEGPVLRKGRRLSLTLPTGVRWERLTGSPDPLVEFLYCTYPVGGESTPADRLISHEGYEYGVILAGRCGATIDGELYELESGDSIAFESQMPHRIWNLCGEETMLAIWTVLGRRGDSRFDNDRS